MRRFALVPLLVSHAAAIVSALLAGPTSGQIPAKNTAMTPPTHAAAPASRAQHGQREGGRANRLAGESSLYLLQHACNPVDWRPWGEAAFKAARDQDKPIFLSIGYSTCYWCHVMERESFESEQTAALMNERFVCIKVDREQRPDVDDIYMTAVQLLTGSGGWPMSVFLEPKTLKPFVAGTYFPPEDNFGRPGFPSVLQQVAAHWKDNREAVLQQAEQVAAAIVAQHTVDAQPVELASKHVDEAVAALLSSYDNAHGGFGGGAGGRHAPKFPMPANLDLLMGAVWENPSAKQAVLHTLERMALGGMYDQVAGGFHRYSVDQQWLVPHFEKMLYDNAQLAATYARAHELTRDPFHAQIVRETLDYVLREMTGKDGGFFSAQDAEVNAREGGSYVWNAQELTAALQAAGLAQDVEFALAVFGLSGGPNFQDPHHPEDEPKNVLRLTNRPAELAEQFKQPPAQFAQRLERVKKALLQARAKREQPATDDKILAGWNGLMIAGFADAGRVLNQRNYTDAARRAAEFVLTSMRAADGGLMRSWREGQPQIDGFLEDYAFMIRGLLALHRATSEQRWLDEAARLAQAARDRFWDNSAGAGGGGYFDTREAQGDLFVRIKSIYDGAVPSGNSVMLLNLLELHERTKERRYLDDASAASRALSSAIAKHPVGSVLAILAVHRLLQQRLPAGAPAAAPIAPSAAPAPPAATPPAPKPAAPSSGYGASAEKVTLTSAPREVTLKPGSPATFEVTLEIARNWHINTNAPGDDFAVPLKIELIGAQGLRLTPQFPTGKPFKAGGADNPVQVYDGKITIPVTIEQTGAVTGRPQIYLTYQACNDKVCLEPKRVLVGLRIIAQK